MSSLLTCASLACKEIYLPNNNALFQHTIRINETVCGTSVINNILYLTNQGTVDLKGWLDDIDIEPFHHTEFGNLHMGFYKNIPGLIDKLNTIYSLKDFEIICSGHSKGAAEATILAAMLKLAGFNVKTVYLFGCPNPGMSQFKKWIGTNIPGQSYVNHSRNFKMMGDPVPDVPFSPYVPAYNHTFITSPPSGALAPCIPRKWHSADLYFDFFNYRN